MILPHITIISIYRSPKIQVFIGDFNVNWFDEASRRSLHIFFVNDKYRQLVCGRTTDNRTLIHHIYTNLPESQTRSHILETYFRIIKQYAH